MSFRRGEHRQTNCPASAALFSLKNSNPLTIARLIDIIADGRKGAFISLRD